MTETERLRELMAEAEKYWWDGSPDPEFTAIAYEIGVLVVSKPALLAVVEAAQELLDAPRGSYNEAYWENLQNALGDLHSQASDEGRND